ncbi:MAG: hypothetical protein HYR50_09120 [Candidatus Rokubacteria bacterium]|nr:hypothetical protein [Candidatus Rokubacteria bacterium]
MRMRPLVLAAALVSLVLTGHAAALEVGQKAPDFTLAGPGGKQIKLFGPPTAYLIDRQGRLVARMVGGRDWSTPAVKDLLLEVLRQPAK